MTRLLCTLAILAFAGSSVPAATFTVGHLTGTPGIAPYEISQVFLPLVNAASEDYDFDILASTTLDANFFSQIDLFIYGNSQGGWNYTMGASSRQALVNFVNAGGVAYLGVDQLADGVDIAAAFGFALFNRESLAIFDPRGRRVDTLVSETETLRAGHHVRTWDGVDQGGRRVASGVCFAVLEAAGARSTRKLVLTK